MKKAQFFEIDILIAGLIIVASVVLFTQVSHVTQDAGLNELNNELDDLVIFLTEMKVGELENLDHDNPFFDPEISIARQLLIYNVTGNNDKAENLINEIVNKGYISDNRGYSFGFKGEEAIKRESLPEENQRLTRDIFVTGIESDKPLTGFTGSLFLSQLQRTEPLTYNFGGFFGQGDIDIKINTSGIHKDNITRMRLEGDFPTHFAVSVNDTACKGFNPGILDTTLDDSCKEQLVEGVNNIKFTFPNAQKLEDKYLSGGRIQIYYETSDDTPITRQRKYLPGIKGIFNLYDGFQFDSDVKNITANIDFNSNLYSKYDQNNTFIFSVGDEVLVEKENIDGNYQEQFNINHEDFQASTMPYRLGFENVTRVIEELRDVDVVLVTDLSGSMTWNFYQENGLDFGVVRDCDDPDLLNRSTARLSVAKCALLNLTSTLLENENNRVGLVTFADGAETDLGLTNDVNILNDTISGFSANGYTCLSCGAQQTINIFEDDENDEDREQVMVFMSDGEGNRCTDYNWTSSSSSCSGGNATDELLNRTEVLHNDMGVGIFTIAFALEGDGAEAMNKTASIDDENNYYQGLDPESAIEVYDDIGNRILEEAGFISQIITGDFESDSTLLRNTSYIEVERQDSNTEDGFIVNLEYNLNPDDSCNSTIDIPSAVTPLSAEMTSYSRQYWTHEINVNDKNQYNVSDFEKELLQIGDPFIFNIDPNDLNDDSNNVEIVVGNNDLTETYCSPDNKLVIKAKIQNALSSNRIFQERQGCTWEIDFQDETRELTLPKDYSGSNECNYTQANEDYNSNDLYQQLVFDLLRILDTDNDGKLPFFLNEDDLVFNFQSVEGLPFLWGPSVLEVSISK